jgi:hypothetical protein
MSDPTEQAATESVVDLPAAVGEEFDVYVNGILQQPGVDYRRAGRTLVFGRPLEPEVKLTKRQWVRGVLGVGYYRKHDAIDISYQHAGRNLVVTGLKPRSSGREPDGDAV